MANKFVAFIKQNMQNARDVVSGLEQTYVVRLWAIFLLNALGIIGFAFLKENFPLPIFGVIFAVSAFLLFDMLWHIGQKNIKDNFPNDFETESKKYGVSQDCLKCPLIMVGHLRYRGFSCRIYVYHKVLLVKFGKNCLVIDDGRQVKISRALLWNICEFEKDGKCVCCTLKVRQAEIIKAWMRAA